MLVILLALSYMLFIPYARFTEYKDLNQIAYSKLSIFPLTVEVSTDNAFISKEIIWGIKGNIPIDFKNDGNYTVKYTVGFTTEIRKFVIDRTPPVITLDYLRVSNKEDNLLKAMLNEGGTTQLKYIENVLNEETKEIEPKEATRDFTDNTDIKIHEGVNKFTVIATDGYQNTDNVEFEIIGDFTKPKVEIIKPTYNETYNTSEEFQFKITDPNGISKVLLGDKEIAGNEQGVYAFKVDYKDGDNAVNLTVFDKAGNSTNASKTVLKRVTAQNRIKKINDSTLGNAGNGGVTTPTICNNSISGYNIYCYLNKYRQDTSNLALGWSQSNATYASAYAYCLETTNFSLSSNPHYPTQDVKDCMTNKGFSNTKPYGGEVIAANRSSAKSYADAFRASSTHWNIINNPSAIYMGFGTSGKWVVGYIGF